MDYVSSYDVTTPFADDCGQFALATNTVQTYTVPGSQKKFSCIFTYNDNQNVFVSLNVTATVPGAGLNTATRRLEFKPAKHYVQSGDVLQFITPDASAYVGIALLEIPNPRN